jgi:hypothetical protein
MHYPSHQLLDHLLADDATLHLSALKDPHRGRGLPLRPKAPHTFE